MWTPWLPGVPTGGIPVASSTPRPGERQVFGGPLLASAPDGLSPINRGEPSLRTAGHGPLSPTDEASMLASGAPTSRPDAHGLWSPLKTIARVMSRA